MTVVIGVAARDGCVLVADRRTIDWGSDTKVDGVEKLYKIGKNVVIGLAGTGDATKHFLMEAGYIGNDEVFDPRARTDSVANLLRKAFLGKVTSPRWWEGAEERTQHLGKAFGEKPWMHVMIAGFDDAPVLSYIDQGAAFAPCEGLPCRAIGITHWATPILPHIYAGKASDHTIGEAVRAAVFCAYLTSKMSAVVGGGFSVMTVTSRGVEALDADNVCPLVAAAERTFERWVADAS